MRIVTVEWTAVGPVVIITEEEHWDAYCKCGKHVMGLPCEDGIDEWDGRRG